MNILKRVLISTVVSVSALTSTFVSAYDGGTLRTVTEGQLQGSVDGAAQKFLGIPYAATPQRFRAPQNHAGWTGVRSATSFSDICAQQPSFFGDPDPTEFENPAVPRIGTEDCLYLNIYRPNNTSGNLPVMFWIHGGANIYGAGSEIIYDGKKLADEQDMVVVTINYRLSTAGWFYHPALAATSDARDGSGNYAHMDIVKALEWVNTNIDEFGGDDNNITIAGQSAGCFNVYGLVVDRSVENLFDKVICQSGFPQAYPTAMGAIQATDVLYKTWVAEGVINSEAEGPIHEATLTNQQIADYLRNTANIDNLIANQPGIIANHFEDGTVYPVGMWARFLSGNYNKKPMIIGSTADEGTLFLSGLYDVNQAELWALIQQQDPTGLTLDDFMADTIQAPALATASVLSTFVNMIVDKVVRSQRLVQTQPIYRYTWHWDNSPGVWKDLMGAYHAMDVAFMFGNFPEQDDFSSFSWNSSNSSSREAMSSKMRKYVGQFVENGNPNRMFDGLTNWDNWSNWSTQYKRLLFKANGSTQMSFDEYFFLDYQLAYGALDATATSFYDDIADDEDIEDGDFPSSLLSD